MLIVRAAVAGLMLMTCLTATLAEPAIGADTYTPMLQFNMCGNVCNVSSNEVADKVAESININRPRWITLNEICESQLNRIVSQLTLLGLVAYQNRHTHFDTGVNCSNGTNYGNALIWSVSEDMYTSYSFSFGLPYDGSENRVMGCQIFVFPLLHQLCVTHLSNDNPTVRIDQVREVAEHMEFQVNMTYSILTGGDFNIRPWMADLNRMYLPPVYMGGTGGMLEASPHKREEPSHEYSFSTDLPGGVDRRLDFLFMSPQFGWGSANTSHPTTCPVNSTLGTKYCSDHKLYKPRVISPV